MRTNQKNYAAVYDICEQIADMYRNELENVNAVAEGNLKNFSWDIDWGKDRFQLIFELEDYWQYIEYGRGPSTGSNPPWPTAVADIARWIKVKHIVPRPASSGVIPDIDQMAYSIVRKIHKVGYEARHPYEHAMDKVNQLGLVDMLTDYVINELEMEIADELIA